MNTSLLNRLFLSIILVFSTSPWLYASTFDGNILNHRDSIGIEVLEDKENSLTFNEIQSAASAGKFKPFRLESFNFGITTSDYWLKISLPSAMKQRLDFLEVVNPYIDAVHAYIPTAQNQYTVQRAGDAIPFNDRPYSSRTFIFDLQGRQGADIPDAYYLHIKTGGNLYFLINLWSEKSLPEYLSVSHSLIGFYFGLLLIVGIYSTVICLRLKEPTYCYYALYMCGVIYFMLSINGTGYEYLWTDFPYFAQSSAAASTGLFIVTGLLFSRVFLQTSKLLPNMDKLLVFLLGLACMQVIIAYLGAIPVATLLASSQAVFTPAVIWLTAVITWKKGYRPARFLVVAWTVFLITIMISGLTNLGLLPANLFTVYAIHMGSALEVLLISLALTDRMSMLKKEKEQLQAAYLFKLEETNSKLEKMVDSRTSELQEVTEKAQDKAQQLEAANIELKELSTRDGMTGLLNHQAFFEQLDNAVKNARRYEYYLSVLLMDIDDFKQINDTHGHLVGNEVIKAVANVLKHEIRESDIASRFGGEEFIVVLSHATLTEAIEKAEKIRNQIDNIVVSSAEDLHCTISTGITTLDWHQKDVNLSDVIRVADNAMYQAKARGKNRIKVAEIDYKVVNGND